MYNEDIAKMLEQKFGKRECAIFCQMESMKNSLIAKDMKNKGLSDIDLFDFEYDARWWEDKGKQLRKDLIG